jgi:hypothetical protein
MLFKSCFFLAILAEKVQWWRIPRLARQRHFLDWGRQTFLQLKYSTAVVTTAMVSQKYTSLQVVFLIFRHFRLWQMRISAAFQQPWPQKILLIIEFADATMKYFKYGWGKQLWMTTELFQKTRTPRIHLYSCTHACTHRRDYTHAIQF